MKDYLKPLLVLAAPDSSLKSRSTPNWVQLVVPLEPLALDQALLLCPLSELEWIAWIPDHGEVRLHISEFYLPADWN